MSGYVKQNYVFEGGTLPQKFIEDIYLGVGGISSVRFDEAQVTNWGDDLTVTVSGSCQKAIDEHLKYWENNKESSEEDL